MKVIEIATGYIGQKEVSGNHGFINADFAEKMKAVGFDDGEAWCALFSELCFRLAYPEHDAEFNKLFSEGAVATLTNFTKAGYGISSIPKLGSLMIMQHYEEGVKKWQGHAGIVTAIHSNTEWTSVEGNTSEAGSREGTTVLPKRRSLMYKPTGLRVAGFVMIVETLKLQ